MALSTHIPEGLDRKEAEVFAKLDASSLPHHIAIIMDGNGRWARKRHLPRIALDQTTGNIAMSWYDARTSKNNDDAQIYAAVSVDGGKSFSSNIRVSLGTSNSNRIGDDFDFGDYEGLAFHAGSFYPLWADNSSTLGHNPHLPRPDQATAQITLHFT